MLKTRLEQERKHLRLLNFPPQPVGGLVDFDLNPTLLENCLCALPGAAHQAYYLPWAQNTGYYMDLPSPPGPGAPRIFLTANLSGCCVGVQNLGNFVRIRHYNLFTDDNGHNPAFSPADLFRYGANVHWLLPADKYVNRPQSITYTHGGPYAEAIFWGEYKANWWFQAPRWHFYYQNGNGGTKVNDFNYW